MQTIPFNVNPNTIYATHFVINKELGYSKFPVYLVQILPQGGEYAIKVFPDTEAAKDAYMRELDILHTVSHPNIVKIRSDVSFENMNSAKCHYILLEYAPYGDFFSVVKSRGLKSQKIIRTYFRQIIEGLEHLHLHQIAHLDLKLENLLLGKNFRLELADFDQSRNIKEKLLADHGTSCYRSPELLAGKCEDFFAADVYAAGIVLFLLRTREFPFMEHYKGGQWELLDYDLFQKNNKLFWEKKAQNKKDPDFFTESFKELINGMLEVDPAKRWTLQDIKNCRWYMQTVLTEIELKICIEKVVERMAGKQPVKVVP